MPKVYVEKSILIKSSIEEICATLCNFSLWGAWSPWLIMEPEATVEVSADQHYYSWDGKRVGVGNMQLLTQNITAHAAEITYALNFVSPFKSYADVAFQLHPDKDAIKVTWIMKTSLPFFLFWMKKSTAAMIGMDYERGLRMLKEVVETGDVKSTLSFLGESSFPKTRYIGIESYCDIDQLPNKMATDFDSLMNFVNQHQGMQNADPFSIYHKWDMIKQRVHYTAAVPVTESAELTNSEFMLGEIPQTSVYTLQHAGPYEHIGNAWATLYNMHYKKEIKCAKGIPPFEVYRNSPIDTAPENLITEIKFPLA